MKKPAAADKPRNLLHDHPLLRKGGVHEKSRKAARRAGKMALHKGEWGPQNAWLPSVVPAPFAFAPGANA